MGDKDESEPAAGDASDGTPEKAEIAYPTKWGYRIVCSSVEEVRAHLRKMLEDTAHELVVGNESSGGTYTSLLLTLVVVDEAHRLRIYEHLVGHDAVRFVL